MTNPRHHVPKREVAWGFFWDAKPVTSPELIAHQTRRSAQRERSEYRKWGAYVGPIFKITGPVTARRAVGRKK